MPSEPARVIACRWIGLDFERELHWKEIPTSLPEWPVKYEVRTVVRAMFGQMIYSDSDDPFDERCMLPVLRGVGMTRERALEALERDLKQFHDGMWV